MDLSEFGSSLLESIKNFPSAIKDAFEDNVDLIVAKFQEAVERTGVSLEELAKNTSEAKLSRQNVAQIMDALTPLSGIPEALDGWGYQYAMEVWARDYRYKHKEEE